MSRWLLCRERRPGAALRLYCFPPAGGTTGDYLRWSDVLPDIEVWGVQPPGRGDRLEEPPFTRLEPLIESLLGDVVFEAPFAFFGHSMGALLAFEVTRRLRDEGREQPECLFVSAHRAPHLPHGDAPIHELPGPAFLRVYQERYPALPDDLLADDELLEQVLATHRADLAVFESYRHVAGRPLDCRLVVIGGAEDRWTEADLARWRSHTTGPFRVLTIPGDHFLLRSSRDHLVRIVAAHVREVVER